jgi:hypothetical protein
MDSVAVSSIVREDHGDDRTQSEESRAAGEFEAKKIVSVGV